MDSCKKNVLITGASRGIGRAIAQKFAGQGARIAVHYQNNQKAAEKTIASLDGKSHLMIQADLADPGAVDRMVQDVIRSMEKIDILVNNAGVYTTYAISELSYQEWLQEWHKTVSVNLFGAANVSFLVARHMIPFREGKIITISSRGAFRGEPNSPAYGASKAGLNAMSQSLAVALAPFNIYVYVIAPGFVETDMTSKMLSGPEGEAIRAQSPLHRAAKPEEIAETALFLAFKNTDYLTGSIIDINGASYLRS
jgi:NAD(P)-dependent dehydrogenase (short-subunit alcohol dehydrogenase family)